MKQFSNHAKYFAQHGANIGLRLLMALFIVFAAATVLPGLVAFIPHVIAICVAVYLFIHLFNGKRSKGVLLAATQADIFNPTQLQQKAIVLASIYSHYGWKQNGDGSWGKVEGSRDIPEILDKLRITRRDLLHVKYLTPLESTFKFFDKAQEAAFPFNNNVKEINLPANKMYVLFGIKAELATGAAAADTVDILDFKTPVAGTDEEVLNGLFSYKVNTKQMVDNSGYKAAFVNDDAIKDFFRFPEPIVWEPSNSQEIELKLCKSYAAAVHKFQRFTILAFELTI